MTPLSHRERVAAALSFAEVDRIPYSVWTHYPGMDLFPAELARAQVRDAVRYDFDFIKIANNGLFSVLDYGTTYVKDAAGRPLTDRYGTLTADTFGVAESAQWRSLPVLDPERGCLGEQLEIIRRIRAGLDAAGKGDLPVVATIYSPLTSAYKLGGELLVKDMKERPEDVHAALRALCDTAIRYARRCIESGADGFFFASQLSRLDLMDEETYGEFGERYDRLLFEAFAGRTFLDIVHIHGEQAMFGKLAAYPANCVNWHDRWIGPSIAEARSRTSKCLLGGIDEENALGLMTDDAFARHLEEAIAMGKGGGFILGPGCTASPNTPENHMRMIREVLERSR